MLRNGLEPWHILIVVAVVVLMFGSKKLPDMARGLGKSMRILKAETAAMREDVSAAARSDAAPDDRTARPAVEPQPLPAEPGEQRSRRPDPAA
ncbi:Sec-independent protein translocase subunit TatA [Kitasatospora sp. NPDC048365]|uniref:Sec-independent protein translocase subunit TatA n=1 Tax=Kitasatospora sp. NPDC048365 TaxID=3364050 RepID=UPI003720F629